MKHPLFPVGYEFEWCGVDRRGHVAVFCIAGSGPVPVALLDDPAAWDREYEALDQLPPSSSAGLTAESSGISSVRRAAERGLFFFDWSPPGQPMTAEYGYYWLEARPAKPALLQDLALPDDVRDRIGRIRLDLDLVGTDTISFAALMAALPAGAWAGA